jgi:hypothetical protein
MLLQTVHLKTIAQRKKPPSSALTADDFYFYDALGKKYMPGTLTDKSYGLVLSSIEKVLKQKYYTFRKLAINDDASKISELYNEVDWDYDIYIPDEIYNGTAAETAEYLNKLLEIKNKPEFVNLHNAGEFIENESSIIGDENFQIFLQFKMVSIDNKLYAYNELPEVKKIDEISQKYGVRRTDSLVYISAKLGKEKYDEYMAEVGSINVDGDYYYCINILIEKQIIKEIVTMVTEMPKIQG